LSTPLDQYQQLLSSGQLSADSLQLTAVEKLTQLHQQLLHTPAWWQRKPPPPRGLYLWGPVGRGKTMLMDLFCNTLPAGLTLRLHFHRFMREIHQQLRAASGQPDPLDWVAQSFARKARVLCFDEFFVDNIGDAMLLGRLLGHLFRRGVVLVATSNQPPAGLYPDGLHRDRFIPAINLLEKQLETLPLDGPEDHRLRHLTAQKSWFDLSKDNFELPKADLSDTNIELCQRTVECLQRQNKIRTIAFSFQQLCTGYRSAMDYIELAEQFDTVWLCDVPRFYAMRREQIKARGTEDGSVANSTGEREVCWSALDDPARRFISLVDELYDRRVNLMVSAAAPAAQLYPADGALNFQFQRTLSRLVEMGSLEYQQSPPIRD